MSDEKREPLLSEKDARDFIEGWNGSIDDPDWPRCVEQKMYGYVRNFYEDLIDTGVLMVVKEGVPPRVKYPTDEEDEAELGCACWITGCCGIGPIFKGGHDKYCCKCGTKINYEGVDTDSIPDRITTAPASPSKSHPK